MRIFTSDKFDRNFLRLPKNIQEKAKKKIKILATDMGHPSLRVKKMKDRSNVWEARIDNFYRLTFWWEKDSLTFRTIGPHDEALKT